MDELRPADDRVEHADFAPTRIGGRARRGGGPVLIAGWLIVLGVVVGAGAIGRTLDGRTLDGLSIGARPSLLAAGISSIRPTAVAERAPALQQPPGPARSSDPDALAYDVARDSIGLAITGTILARPAVWVFISIQDPDGSVITWRSLSVEDPSGGIRPDRTPSFQAHVALAAPLAARPLIVEVNAYNDLGRKIGSVRQVYDERAGHNPLRIGTGMVR